MQKMITTELKIIPIDKIIEPNWDIRQTTKNDSDSDNNNFAGLVQSIKTDGVLNPIIVSKNGTDKYEIFAGRRRFKACKMLGLKEIPATIRLETTTTNIEDNKGEKQRIALVENLHRKDLSDIEKANGILSVYTNAGYQPQNVIRFIKFLDNNGYQPGNTTDRNRLLSLGNVP
jgi:ParB/RepB/Spo0J family partition protein